MSDALRLYLVADPDHTDGDLPVAVEAALQGGVTAVQLRAKRLTDRDHLALAETLARLCHANDASFFVNDRVDIALAANADGVHLGVDDLPVSEARRIAGPEFLIGYSPETDAQIAAAAIAGANYLGVGPVFGTATKSDAGTALGLREFGRRCDLSPIPVVGIGGITVSNAASVMGAGAVGVAVVSAILRASDPNAAARLLRNQVETSVR